MTILTLGYAMKTTITNVYAPTAEQDEEDTKQFYDEL